MRQFICKIYASNFIDTVFIGPKHLTLAILIFVLTYRLIYRVWIIDTFFCISKDTFFCIQANCNFHLFESQSWQEIKVKSVLGFLLNCHKTVIFLKKTLIFWLKMFFIGKDVYLNFQQIQSIQSNMVIKTAQREMISQSKVMVVSTWGKAVIYVGST